MLDLVITPRASILIASLVTPITLLTDHHAVECDLLVVKPARSKCRVRCRKYTSIGKRTCANDIYDALSLSSRSTIELFDTYKNAIANTVRQTRTDHHTSHHGPSEDAVVHRGGVQREALPRPCRASMAKDATGCPQRNLRFETHTADNSPLLKPVTTAR